MSEKLFFFDPLQGLRRSYGDLYADAIAIPTIPEFYWSNSCYDLMIMLVAALSRHAELGLWQECPSAAQAAEVKAIGFGSDPKFRHSDLARQLASSLGRLGVFTSGSTGRPKLIWHRVETLLRSARVHEKHGDDVWGLTYYPTHFAGLQVFFQAILNQNTLVRLHGLNPTQTRDTILEHGVTHISGTPTYMRLLCSSKTSFPSVTRVSVGGEICTPQTVTGIRKTFPAAKFQNFYASTEVGHLLTAEGDCFRIPAEYADCVQVLDGELAVHRSLLASSLHDSYDQEFYRTGDQVEVVQHDPLVIRFESRAREMINVGGYKVNPHEVEAILLEMEEIVDARIYGKSNPVTGQLTYCDIVQKQGTALNIKLIRERLSSRLQSYEIPRVLNLVEEIPTTHSGKTRRLT